MVSGAAGNSVAYGDGIGVGSKKAGPANECGGNVGAFCGPGMLVHLLSGGVIFPLGYIVLSSQSLSGTPVLQGMLWAGLLWFVAEVIMAPMLGAEVFSTALGGLPAALRALLGYLVYGATLGGIVGTVQPEDRHASHAL